MKIKNNNGKEEKNAKVPGIVTKPQPLYKRLVEFTGDAVYRYTYDDGRIVFANKGFVELCELDCDPAELFGRRLKDLMVYVEKEGIVREKLEEFGEIHDFEYHFKTLKGEDRWVIHDSFLAKDPDSGKKIVESIVRDITKWKKVEREILHLNEIVRAIRDIDQAIVRKKNRDELIRSICLIMTGIHGYSCACICLTDKEGTLKCVDCSQEGSECNKALKRLARKEKPPLLKKILSSPEIIVEDGSCFILSGKKEQGPGRMLGVRLEHEGKVYGTMIIHSKRFSPPDKKELDMFLEVAEDVAFALYNIEKEKQRFFQMEELEGFKSIIERGPAVVFLWRSEEGWPVEYVSDNVEQFGYTAEDFVSGRVSWPSITHPDDWARIKREIIGYQNDGIMEFSQQYRLTDAAGKTHWIEDRTKAVVSAEGVLTHYQGIILDVTKRKNAQLVMAEAEKGFQDIIEQNADAIIVVDKRSNVIKFANQAAEKLMGASRRNLTGRPLDLAVTGNLETQEVDILRADGEEVTVEVRCVETVQKDKAIYVLSLRDITKRKHAERKLKMLNDELLGVNSRLERLSLIDLHTGIYNHRYLEQIIGSEFDRAKRYIHPVSVILIDIDYFKSINDLYGHQFGDLIIKQFSDYLKKLIRKYDVLARYGGEEFVIVCPGSDRQATRTLANRILDAINLYVFGDGDQAIKLKVSMGVASYPEDRALKGMGLIDMADKVLLFAKDSGGNRAFSAIDMEKTHVQEDGEKEVDVDALRNTIDKLTKKTNQSLVESIFALAKTIELKDHYTGEHVEMTAYFATEIARNLGLSADHIEKIRQASALHDLGKIGISEAILGKKSKLTEKEYEEIKRHPQIGADILRPVQFLQNIIPLIFHHHERWDGKGYPSGLKGEDIPLGARIIAIADVYQALISDRPYRRALSQDRVMEIIKSEAGAQFDPKIVDVFLRVLEQKDEDDIRNNTVSS